MLTQPQEKELTGGGLCNLHSHLDNHRPTADEMRILNTLENVKYITAAQSPYTQGLIDDKIMVDTSGGAVVVNLMKAQSVIGNKINISKFTADNNGVTINANGTDKINLSSNSYFMQGGGISSLSLKAQKFPDGTYNWFSDSTIYASPIITISGITYSTPDVTSGTPKDLAFVAGSATVTGAGAGFSMASGAGTAGFTGGNFVMGAGDAGANGFGGNFNIAAGNTSGGGSIGGNVVVYAGAGATNGQILLGDGLGATQLTIDETGTTITAGKINGATLGEAYNYNVPVAAFNFTIANATNVQIFKPAGLLATGTVKMPASPINGQIVRITSTQQITGLTHSPNTGQTLNGALTTILANGFGSWIYRAADTSWYRIG